MGCAMPEPIPYRPTEGIGPAVLDGPQDGPRDASTVHPERPMTPHDEGDTLSDDGGARDRGAVDGAREGGVHDGGKPDGVRDGKAHDGGAADKRREGGAG